MALVDHVARALLSAMAVLAEVAESGQDSSMALNALESIAHDLGEMNAEERREFVAVLERIAAAEPAQAAWIRDVPRNLGWDAR